MLKPEGCDLDHTEDLKEVLSNYRRGDAVIFALKKNDDAGTGEMVACGSIKQHMEMCMHLLLSAKIPFPIFAAFFMTFSESAKKGQMSKEEMNEMDKAIKDILNGK